MKKINLMIVAFMLTINYSMAQLTQVSPETSFFDDTYLNLTGVSASAISSSWGLGYYGSGYGVQFGKHFSPYIAAQVNWAQTFSSKTEIYSASVDLLWNISNTINYDEDRRLTTSLLAAAGLTNLTTVDGTRDYASFDLGAQLKYALNNKFDLLAELRGGLAPDDLGNIPFTDFINAKVGISYHLGREYKQLQQNSRSSIAVAAIEAQRAQELQEQQAKQEQQQEQFQQAQENTSKLEDEIAQLKKQLAEEQRKNKELEAQAARTASEVTPSPIFFSSERSTPSDANIEMLKYTAEVIKANPNVTYLVEGYADAATGTASYNQMVSEKRARSVAKALVERYNINAEQLKAVGMGGVSNLADKSHFNRCVIIKAE